MFHRQDALPGHQGSGSGFSCTSGSVSRISTTFSTWGQEVCRPSEELHEFLQGVHRLGHEIVNTQDGPGRGRIP